MTFNPDAVSLFIHRRAIFSRLTATRNSSYRNTSESSRLDAACARSASRLMESSNAVIQSLGGNAPLQKLRIRLSHELTSLQTSSKYLSDAMKSLRFATVDVFGGDVPVLHNLRLYRHKRPSSSRAIGGHCKIAASQVDEARKLCSYVRREIYPDLTLKLRTRKNVAQAALAIIFDVQRKVQRLEIQTTEQLAIITAADAEMKIFSSRAKKGTKRDRNIASSPKIPDVKRALVLLKTLT